MSDIYYTITPNRYKNGDYSTGTRRDHLEIKAMYRELREALRKGADTEFATKQEARVALGCGLTKIGSAYTVDDFEACETCSFF